MAKTHWLTVHDEGCGLNTWWYPASHFFGHQPEDLSPMFRSYNHIQPMLIGNTLICLVSCLLVLSKKTCWGVNGVLPRSRAVSRFGVAPLVRATLDPTWSNQKRVDADKPRPKNIRQFMTVVRLLSVRFWSLKFHCDVSILSQFWVYSCSWHKAFFIFLCVERLWIWIPAPRNFTVSWCPMSQLLRHPFWSMRGCPQWYLWLIFSYSTLYYIILVQIYTIFMNSVDNK